MPHPHITVRFTASDYAAVRDTAKAAGKKLNSWAHEQIAKPPKIPPREPLDCRMSIYFTDAERELIASRAESAGMVESEYVREVLIRKARK